MGGAGVREALGHVILPPNSAAQIKPAFDPHQAVALATRARYRCSISQRPTTMTPQAVANFKAQLLTRRTDFFDQLATLRGGPVGRVEASADHFGEKKDSTAQETTAREIEFALDAHESAELALVDAALRRIEVGSFGTCIDCGVAIPLKRLHARPEAARCIACQQKSE